MNLFHVGCLIASYIFYRHYWQKRKEIAILLARRKLIEGSDLSNDICDTFDS